MWFVAVLALWAQSPGAEIRAIEQLIAAGKHGEALAALEREPDSFARRLMESKAYDGAGDAARAVERAEAALALDPRSEAAHLQLGQIFLSRNTPQAALEVFSEALAIHPESFLLRAGRGLALKDLVLYEEAEKELKACLAAKPGFPVCFDGLATVYLHGKQYGELAAAAGVQQTINPGDYRGYYFAAVARNATGSPREGTEKLLGAALMRNPNFAAAHALLGRLQLERGNVAAAIELLEKAVRLRAHYPPALLNLAQAYRRAGREADAERAYAALREANERERQGHPTLIYRRGGRAAEKN